MATLLAVDGNYFLWRAMDVCAKNKNPKELKKNTFSMFLSMVASDAKVVHATHVHVCFDAIRSFRNDLYPDYKANRIKGKGMTITLRDGNEFYTDLTPGGMVKEMKEVLDLAGLANRQVKGRESDDQLGSLALLGGPKLQVVLDTRDKDMAGCVNAYVRQYWPTEKKFLDAKAVFKYFKVHPHQMRDYLCLLGDKIDNIPGVPGIGQDTAAKWLAQHGDISKMLKDEKIRERLRPHMANLVMAKKLVTLRTDIEYDLDDMVPRKINPELADRVWSIPSSLKDLADSRKMLKLKGLFG